MRLEQFERRLERLIEGAFARAFRSGLQPVEVGRRLTREMDLRRTVAPRGTITPNAFAVFLSPADHDRFEPIEEELISELIAVATEHARDENYMFLGPVSVTMETDPDLTRGIVVIEAEMYRQTQRQESKLVMPDGHSVTLGTATLIIGRLPDCGVVLSDRNVSRYHAEVRPVEPADGALPGADPDYQIADLGSTNGTAVNGMPVTAPRTLRAGDQITVGATTIRFEVEGTDEEPGAAARGRSPAKPRSSQTGANRDGRRPSAPDPAAST